MLDQLMKVGTHKRMNIFRQLTSNRLKGALNGPAASDLPDGGGGGGQRPDCVAPANLEKQINKEEREAQQSAAEDAEWVSLAQAGDMQAYDQLVSKHRGKIYAMILNMVKNDADAWDLSQVAFVKAWRALPKFESRAKFSTWLFRISHNVVYDWLRKRRIQGDGELNDEIFDAGRIDPGSSTSPYQHDRPDQAMERQELQQQLDHAINQLSPDHREAILLREVHGLDYKEIAVATDSSIGTIMSRLYYARKKLQTLLSPPSA